LLWFDDDGDKAVARQEEKGSKAFLASPVGKARTAYEDGAGFFELKLTVGSIRGEAIAMSGTKTTTKSHTFTDVLSQVEAVGWHLEHVGYLFVHEKEVSRDKFFSSGQQTAISGRADAIYLFRRSEPRD
jgi:hypothetical protein